MGNLQIVCAIGNGVHRVAVTRRKKSPTFCARVFGVTITVNQASSGVWHWAPWSDSPMVTMRLQHQFNLRANKRSDL